MLNLNTQSDLDLTKQVFFFNVVKYIKNFYSSDNLKCRYVLSFLKKYNFWITLVILYKLFSKFINYEKPKTL